MALGYNFVGAPGEQVFSTSPQISDILARYFGTPAPSTTPAAPSSSGTPGSANTVGGTSLARPLGSDIGTRGSGFGSDNGIMGEATSFADRNTAVNPSLMGSLALAGSILPGGIGLPLGGPLASLALQALGVDTSGILGNLGTALGIGGSPFNVAGPALSPEAVQGVINSISSMPANTPRVTVMNALNTALAKARGEAQGNAATGAQTAYGADASGLGGRLVGGGFASGYGAGANGSLAGSGVGGGILGSSTNAAGNRGPQGAASGNDGGGAMSGGGPEGAGGGPSLSGGR